MWDIKIACEKVLQHFIDERNKAPKCVVCDTVLYDYDKHIYNYLYLLEVKYKKIHVSMNKDILNYVFINYPFTKDKNIHDHHVNYAKDIKVSTCSSCHMKIHRKKHSELHKWLPVDKPLS